MNDASGKVGGAAASRAKGTGRPGPVRRRRSRRGWLALLALVVVGGGGAAAYYGYFAPADQGPRYRFARIEKGTIVSSVSTSGSLKTLVTVTVGSQISGQIKELHADFNSVVKKDQILARIDTANLEAKLAQAKADVEAAKASLLMQIAQLEKGKSELANAKTQTERARLSLIDAKRDLERKSGLAARGITSRTDADKAKTAADLAEAAVESAKAQERAAEAAIKVTEAQIESARATVAQRGAAVRLVEVDLERSVIRSPIDGVVVERSVDVGQTVAASLQSPVLFTIAGSLKEMEVHASVDESDVGRVGVGQAATFTVGAFPRREFTGKVKQIRLAPKEEQSVVTYTVVISADNPENLLLPGMTAEVRIISDAREGVLKVPNAALRFRPAGAPSAAAAGGDVTNATAGARLSPKALAARLAKALELTEEQTRQIETIYEEMRAEIAKLRSGGVPRELRAQRFQAIRANVNRRIATVLNDEQRRQLAELRKRRANREWGQIWVMGGDGKPQAVRVRVGVSDGTFTEIRGRDLKEGQQVIVAAIGGAARTSTAAGRGPRLGF